MGSTSLFFQQLAKIMRGRQTAAPRLAQGVEDIAALVNRSPQLLLLSPSLDRHKQLVQIPGVTQGAYQGGNVKTATRRLHNLARRLEEEHPCASASLREGFEETLTDLTLNRSPRRQRSP